MAIIAVGLPGDLNKHPDVCAVRNELVEAESAANNFSTASGNNDQIEELRDLIRLEVARLAGLGQPQGSL